LLALVLAGAAIAGFLFHRLTHPATGLRPVTPLAAAPSASSGAEQAPVSVNSRKIPDDVPNVSLPGLDGRARTLADFRGKLLIVNFWATWCEPCRREIPLLKSLQVEFSHDGLEIVGIAVDSAQDVNKYVAVHGLNYPVMIGERGGLEAASAFGMDVVLPFSVFADRSGHIVALKVGELRPEEAHLILAGLRELDQGRVDLKTAQTRIAAGLADLSAHRTPVPAVQN
jgi:peroxiredoxin